MFPMIKTFERQISEYLSSIIQPEKVAQQLAALCLF